MSKIINGSNGEADKNEIPTQNDNGAGEQQDAGLDIANMENFVNDATTAVIAGKTNVNSLVKKYSLNPDEAAQLTRLIKWLYGSLMPVKPSRRFSYRLKQDLMGTPDHNMVERIRYLPPRVQIAAGVALVAGVMLLARRRVNISQLTHHSAEAPEIAIAQ